MQNLFSSLFCVLCSFALLFGACAVGQTDISVQPVIINSNGANGLLPSSLISLTLQGNPSIRVGISEDLGASTNIYLLVNGVDMFGLVQPSVDFTPFKPLSAVTNNFTVVNETGYVYYSQVLTYDGPQLISLACLSTLCIADVDQEFYVSLGVSVPQNNQTMFDLQNYPDITTFEDLDISTTEFMEGQKLTLFISVYATGELINQWAFNDTNTNINTTVLPYFADIYYFGTNKAQALLTDGVEVQLDAMLDRTKTYACVFEFSEPNVNVTTTYREPYNWLNCQLPANLSQQFTTEQTVVLVSVVSEDPSDVVYDMNSVTQQIIFRPPAMSTTTGSKKTDDGLPKRTWMYIGIGVGVGALLILFTVGMCYGKIKRARSYEQIHHHH